MAAALERDELAPGDLLADPQAGALVDCLLVVRLDHGDLCAVNLCKVGRGEVWQRALERADLAGKGLEVRLGLQRGVLGGDARHKVVEDGGLWKVDVCVGGARGGAKEESLLHGRGQLGVHERRQALDGAVGPAHKDVLVDADGLEQRVLVLRKHVVREDVVGVEGAAPVAAAVAGHDVVAPLDELLDHGAKVLAGAQAAVGHDDRDAALGLVVLLQPQIHAVDGVQLV